MPKEQPPHQPPPITRPRWPQQQRLEAAGNVAHTRLNEDEWGGNVCVCLRCCMLVDCNVYCGWLEFPSFFGVNVELRLILHTL